MKPETIKILQLFVEKARVLNQTRFVRFYAAHELSMSAVFDLTTGTGTLDPLIMPDAEEITAFTAVLRFFVMKNEKASFRSLADLSKDHDLSKRWQAVYQTARDKINKAKLHTSERALFLKDEDGTVLTDEVIFDTFVNGDIMHCEMPKRERFQRWKTEADWFQGVTFRFLAHVLGIANNVFDVAFAAEMEMQNATDRSTSRESRIPGDGFNRSRSEAGWVTLKGRAKPR